MSSMVIHNNGVHIMSEKEIASKLDDYKSKYDMNKFIENLRNKMEKEKIYSTTEMNETSKTLNTTSRRKNNKPKVLQSKSFFEINEEINQPLSYMNKTSRLKIENKNITNKKCISLKRKKLNENL